MIDLLVMVIRCDVTRVVTHMLDDARSELEYRCIPEDVRAKVGLAHRPESGLHYHASQHGAGTLDRATEGGRYRIIEESNLDFAAINCWLGQKTAALAARLDAIREGDGKYYGLGVASFGDDLRGEPNRLLEEILR
ncbi:hypothetical protein WMF26_20730 [Sorangium sp. So ce185]|uniref:hypothetical protein n=1 Tax=Sorangium sp. So ce185 TaxID=3133287 RepID=UPI003F6022D9